MPILLTLLILMAMLFRLLLMLIIFREWIWTLAMPMWSALTLETMNIFSLWTMINMLTEVKELRARNLLNHTTKKKPTAGWDHLLLSIKIYISHNRECKVIHLNLILADTETVLMMLVLNHLWENKTSITQLKAAKTLRCIVRISKRFRNHLEIYKTMISSLESYRGSSSLSRQRRLDWWMSRLMRIESVRLLQEGIWLRSMVKSVKSTTFRLEMVNLKQTFSAMTMLRWSRPLNLPSLEPSVQTSIRSVVDSSNKILQRWMSWDKFTATTGQMDMLTKTKAPLNLIREELRCMLWIKVHLTS